MEVKAPQNLRAGLVSIGLPVYNGGRYLREALDSLVTQDYQDLEIIISDNASDDETEAICREFASHDPRIRYYRGEQNMGPVWNTVRAYELAQGEYFMLAAHDDVRDPQNVSQCVARLDRNPRALLCCTGVRLIDEAGEDISDTLPFHSYPPSGATPRERLLALVRSNIWLHIYSLMRTPALAQTRFGELMWGGDVVLVAEMCLRGEVECVPEKLFNYRYFPSKTTDDIATGLSTTKDRVTVGWSDLAADLIESVHRSTLGFAEKLRLKWMIVIELCFRNKGVSWAIFEEGLKPARRALAAGKYRHAITLGVIGLLKQTVGFFERIVNSIRYRRTRLKAAMVARKAASSRGSRATEVRK